LKVEEKSDQDAKGEEKRDKFQFKSMALRPEYTKESRGLPPSIPVNFQYHNSALMYFGDIHKPVVVLITSFRCISKENGM
jgi:hypothetical protein